MDILIKDDFYYSSTMGLQDRFTFGKYNGKKLIAVIKCDVSYITWLMKNINSFVMDKAAVLKYVEVLTEDDDRDFAYGDNDLDWMDEGDIPY